MPEQLSLPGLDSTSLPFRLDVVPTRGRKLRGYTLFLAIFPRPEDAHGLALAAAHFRRQHELNGAPLLPDRLHITLHKLAAFIDTVPQAVLDAAMAASSRVVCPPLPIVFDHVQSFSGSKAFVLRCDPASDEAVARLREPLALALQRVSLRPKPSRAPHMTMLYDPHLVVPHAIEPICWTARRFALILSHEGLHHHQWVDEWKLAD